MDCVVAYHFFHLAVTHGVYHYWYFGLTVTFVLLPSLTMTGFSLRWYLQDAENAELPEVPTWRWILRILMLLLQVCIILTYFLSVHIFKKKFSIFSIFFFFFLLNFFFFMFFPFFLQIAPILRYVDSMRYGLQSRKFGSIEGKTDDFEEKKSARVQRIKNYKLMVYEDSDATLLRLFECFMESAPQLILQVCLEVKFGQN